jgi:hypothetical protein
MTPEGSFRPDGYYAKEMRWARPHEGVLAYTSDPAPNTGVLRSTPFRLPSVIHFFTVGFLSHTGFRVYLIDEANQRTIDLRTRSEPGMTWKEHFWRIPSYWQGKTVRLVAEDNATGPEDWMGVTAPEAGGEGALLSVSRALYRTATFIYLALLFLLPGAAAAIFLSRKFTLSFLQFIPAIFCGSGLAGYIAFWAYLDCPCVGKPFSVLIVGASAFYMFFNLKLIPSLPAIREVALCLGLALLMGVFYSSVGFLYYTDDGQDVLAQVRFGGMGSMPPDNVLPLILAERLYVGASPKPPLVSIWQGSDRPPLQSGAALMTFPFANVDRSLAYQLLGVFLQCIWLPALWVLLRCAGISNRYLIPLIAFATFSHVCVFHSFFVWPKLLGSGFVLMALGLVVRAEWKPVDVGLGATCLSLGLLSHTGVGLTIIPLAIFAAITRRAPGWKQLGFGLMIGLLLLMPWRWYQTVYNPPGDHLIKSHLANVQSDEDYKVPFGKLLVDSYSRVTPTSYVSGKMENVRALFALRADYFGLVGGDEWAGLASGDTGRALGAFSNATFFRLFWSLGVLNVGFLCRYLAKPSAARPFADQCMWIGAGAIVVWILAIFPPGSTVIHNGSLANVLILFVPLVIYIVEAGPRFICSLLAVQALIVFPLVAFAKPWVEAVPGALVDGPVDPGMALVGLLAISSIAYIGWRVSRKRNQP